MFKVGICIGGKWRYYWVEGEEAVERAVSFAIRVPGFDKVSVVGIEDIKIGEERRHD